MFKSGGFAAVLGAAFLVQSGCSDPERFAEPIAIMKQGTDQVTQAVNGAMDTVVNDADLSERFCNEREPVAAKPADELSRPACAMAWEQATEEFRVTTARIWFGREAIDTLSDYVAALEHVLQAETGTPLEAAILHVRYAVRALQDATATLPGSGHSGRSRAMVSGIASFLASIDADAARGEALHEAVVSADPVIDTLIELIAEDVQIAHALHAERAPMQLAGLVQVASAEGGETGASLDGSADPAQALRELDAAHKALVRAVVDGTSDSFDELTFAVDRFARSADVAFQAYDSYLALLRNMAR